MSSPRLAPWLMPETISCASKPSISPSVAKRTQSTGVPSVAYPTVPSPKSTSWTQIGRRVVIERAVAERLPSGAMTASSTSSMAASARRRACRPSASIPSSWVTSALSTPSRIDRRVIAPGRGDEPLGAVQVHDREAGEDDQEEAGEAGRHQGVVGRGVLAGEVGGDTGADQEQHAEPEHGERAAGAAPQLDAEGPQ